MASSDPQSHARSLLLSGLSDDQKQVVRAKKKRQLVIAGAGSGKTEVMARRIAWWSSVDGIARDRIVAFTFTDRAAEEMKFRIRRHIQIITPPGSDPTLGGMYVGTIHSFCLKMLRELKPDRYHNFDVVDESARHALVQRGYFHVLGLPALQAALGLSLHATIEVFTQAYDLLNEFNQLDVALPNGEAPHQLSDEEGWCKLASLRTTVGRDAAAHAFSQAAARYYAYLRCRRFLDFSTSQSELVRLLAAEPSLLDAVQTSHTHLVVDEIQDINPVQDTLIRLLIGTSGALTAVGDHRQAIYRFRGSNVDLMAKLEEDLRKSSNGSVYELTDNFRSTPTIVSLANRWADTISPVGSLLSPPMKASNPNRQDLDKTHVAAVSFTDREAEADWIAGAIAALVKPASDLGAQHDDGTGSRGLCYSDIAVLLRSARDARLYMSTLEAQGIPAVVRAGPDLFAQPEVLLFLGALGVVVGLDEFLGSAWGGSLPAYISSVLQCNPQPEEVVQAACSVLASSGISLGPAAATRILRACRLLRQRLEGDRPDGGDVSKLATPAMRSWLRKGGKPRRIFPQTLFHWLLAEAGVAKWSAAGSRGETALFHLGQLSSLVKSIETPGWNSPGDFRYQVISLYLWGARHARTDEAPLLVPPDAVTISTIHSAKGLEWPAVFVADVAAQRFPSSRARTKPQLPFSGAFTKVISPSTLADNANYDDERRLMYVALTRAQRYLFVSRSGSRQSKFAREVTPLVKKAGGTDNPKPTDVPGNIRYEAAAPSREALRLVTSFSDLRYYLECPHDFYLRKVLGFAPSIDQAFGYGRGVHNLMRAIHSEPAKWAKLAKDPAGLDAAVDHLVHDGLFYLRYTTGTPQQSMEARAKQVVTDYIRRYCTELSQVQFEPEREFETLLQEEDVLVSGAIDVIRLDDPPSVTLIDFKSGSHESDVASKLDEDEMKLQVSLYGLAAKKELEYEPKQGLVRYLGEPAGGSSELAVPLDDTALAEAKETVVETARNIRARRFRSGPTKPPRDHDAGIRCAECDFREFCGMGAAKTFRKNR